MYSLIIAREAHIDLTLSIVIRNSSLPFRMFRVGLRYREGIFASMTSVILELAVKVIMWECSFGEALM